MTPRQPTSLERALAGALVQQLLSIDGLPEDQIELTSAVRLEEDIAATIHGLDAEDQEVVLRIGLALADEADASGRAGSGIREALRDLGLGDSA